ncbi:MAG: InlB B-repeat-containing protein [Clostridiales bacterium]|nr:InlB B-repeat-containing protein [Clostridiales bacterium]
MKKFTAVLVALVMILTCIAMVACQSTVLVYLENYDGKMTKTIVYDPSNPLPIPEREGYVFGGWYTDRDLTTPFVNGTKMDSNFHVYAKWTAKQQGGGQGGGSGNQGGGSGNQGGGSSTGTPSNVMPKQTYNSSTFDKSNLQQKTMQYDESQGYDPAIGLPSTGSYHALVIPVEFTGESFTQQELDDLEKSLNGPATDTGWESVSTYYSKSSYGALNLTFDVQPAYQVQYSATYYGNYSQKDNDGYYHTGEELILKEALGHYETVLDLTKYDSNGDGCIDAVYLIYSTDVDYENGDSLYWAFTTWYYGDEEYDGLYAYYFLFAGIDFIYESTSKDDFSGAEKISGLKINASTYIHETGHLLGLDDYYDYDEESGSNEGLGGADMMDYTVGDQGVYSKIMLGWIEPTIVNDTATVTIESLQKSSGVRAILIPLNFNNSYFCEYLLIDLYTADGLNGLHAGATNSYLYEGAEFGVRIYHVSSSINNPYNENSAYGSFTDYNNTDTNIALIRLVEADGERKFASSNGLAAKSDLWKKGDKLSSVFKNYTRNDGKTLCFDIEIVSVSAASATITVTFAD